MVDTTTAVHALVERSRRLGVDPSLVVHGGGNTSAMGEQDDHFTRSRPALRIKGSGADLATSDPAHFPGIFLDDFLALRERDAMSEEEMTAFLQHYLMDPASRRPSIETLLHAFLPARPVDHVQANAIVALTKTREPRKVVAEALGEDVAFTDYARPGFELSRMVAELPHTSVVVLAHPGLVTWGEISAGSLPRAIDMVDAARGYLKDRRAGTRPRVCPGLDRAVVEELLPRSRRRLAAGGRCVLHVEPALHEIADRDDVEAVVSGGAATADHILRARLRSIVVRTPDDVPAAIDAYERDHWVTSPGTVTVRLPASTCSGTGAPGCGRHRHVEERGGRVLRLQGLEGGGAARLRGGDGGRTIRHPSQRGQPGHRVRELLSVVGAGTTRARRGARRSRVEVSRSPTRTVICSASGCAATTRRSRLPSCYRTGRRERPEAS